MKVEVLLSTMNLNDNSIIKKMNVNTDILIINQTDHNDYFEQDIDGKLLRIVSNKFRGLSRSRNEALLNATGDICLIADDDINYVDNYEKIIIKAFNELPDADVIVFNTIPINDQSKSIRNHTKSIKRISKFDSYGSVRIAFKRESLLNSHIWFNILFGTGSIFSCGEDSLLFRDFNRKGLKVYEYPEIISYVDYSKSSWFKGYNEKYFYDIGAYLSSAYPNLKSLLKYYYVIRFFRIKEITNRELIKNIKLGMRGYKTLTSYKEYYNEK